MSKKHVTLILIIVLLSIVLVIGSTYAFYIANVSGNDTAENITIASGDFELTFTDSQGIYFEEGIRPGTSASKTFTVENTGTADDTYTYNYNIKLTELDVTYEKQDLVYTLQEYTNDTYETPKGEPSTGYINKNTVNENNEMYLATDIERPPKGELHYYKLTIEFKSLEGVNQNYNQGKTFGGKINVDDNRDAALYEPPKAFSEIIKVDNINIFDDDPDNNLRYAGADEEVNNYIWFNCEDYKNLDQETAKTQCEKWRIIGLFNNVTEANGSIENLVKIIRAEGIGDIAWDIAGTGIWTNASLLKGLNGPYLNNSDNGDWITQEEYTGSIEPNRKYKSYKGITSTTKNMIEYVTWNIGGMSDSASRTAIASDWYTTERGEETYQSQSSTWDGYIGLMYPSDYAHATGGGYTYNHQQCLDTILFNWWSDETARTDCIENDWLNRPGSTQWLFTPFSDGWGPKSHWGVNNAGNITGLSLLAICYTQPSLYLTSDIGIVSGEGTSDIPYIIRSA